MRRGRVRLVGVTALVAGVVGAAFLGPVVVGIAGATGTARVSAEVPNPLPPALAHLRFEENLGQFGLDARFVLRLAGAGIAFEAGGPVLYAGAGSLRMRSVRGADAEGSRLLDSTFLGGAQGDVIQVSFGTGIAVDAAPNAYVVGWTDTTDFPVRGGFQPGLRGEYDSFVTKILPG